MEEQEFDTTGDVEETEDFDIEEEATTENDPWSWAADADPEAVKKTWTQYTQTREEVLAEKRALEKERAELEPISKLREEIMEDPGLVKTIQDYMQGERPAERQVADIERRLTSMQQQMAVQQELSELRKWIEERDYPELDERQVLEYAATNGIGRLRAAYNDMNVEAIQDVRADRVVAGIKKSKGAKTIKTKGGDGTRSKLTEEEIGNMSNDEFKDRYPEIMEYYAEKQ